MKNKKIIALMVLISLILSLISFQLTHADDFNDAYKYEMEFLKNVNIIESDYDATLVITKSEILFLILKTLYPDADFSKTIENKISFNDVPETHRNYSYVVAARDLGIIKGDGNNNFCPDKQITLAETLAIVVNSLGYTYHAEEMGGYPFGYYQISQRIGLLKNVNLSVNDIVNGGDVVRIIYNALFSNIVDVLIKGENKFEVKIDASRNILYERYSIKEYNGVIIDNGIVSIEGQSVSDQKKAVIKLNKTGETITAYSNGTDFTKYLGCNVKAFIKFDTEKGRNEFLYVTEVDESDVLVLNAKDITDANNNYIEYTEDINDTDVKKVNLPTKRPILIYNGIKIIDKTFEELIPEDGFIKLIDNTRDGIYDIILVLSFNYSSGIYNAPARNIVIDRVVTDYGEEGISCLYNPSASIDLNESEYIYNFILNDKYNELSKLKSGLVLSVAEAPEKVDGKTYYMLAVSENEVSGNIAYIDDTECVYLSDDEYYNISSSITSVKPTFINSLKSGDKVNMLIDVTGKAAYVTINEGGSKNYAYIIKAEKISRGEEYISIKYFSKDGGYYDLPLSEKAVVDGVSVSGKTITQKLALINNRPSVASTIINAKPTGRPAIIKTNSDSVIGIDTDTPNADLSFGKISDTYVQQSVIQYYEEDAESYDTLKAGFRSPRADAVRGTSKTVGGKFFITSNTVILNVPEIDTYALNKLDTYAPFGNGNLYLKPGTYSANNDMIAYYAMENSIENYKVLSLSNLGASYSHDIQGYDIDPDTGVAGLVVVRGRTDTYRSGNISKTVPMSVYLKKTDVYDSDTGKMVTKIYYYEQGTEKSATIDLDGCYYPYKALVNGSAKNATPHGAEVVALRKGDVIRVIQSGGKISHIERVFRSENINNAGGYVEYSQAPTVSYSKSVSGTNSTFPFDMPLPDKDAKPEENHVLITAYPVNVSGTTLQLACNKKEEEYFSAIDFDNPMSYSKRYFKLNNNNITVIEYLPSGDIKIKKGDINDIVSYKDANKDVTGTSVIITKLISYELEQIIVINGLNNI